jgi:hypothetical protein
MVGQFRQKHQKNPVQIVVAPVALLLLGMRRSLPTMVEGIPVICRLFEESEVVDKNGTKLGVFVYKQGDHEELRSCDLA